MTRRSLQDSQMHSHVTADEPCISTSGRASGRAFAVAALVVAFGLAAPPASFASGSIGGGSGVSQFGQMYKQGKVVFFRKLACRSGCPIQRDRLDKGLAANLVESITTAGRLEGRDFGPRRDGQPAVPRRERQGLYRRRRARVGWPLSEPPLRCRPLVNRRQGEQR